MALECNFYCTCSVCEIFQKWKEWDWKIALPNFVLLFFVANSEWTCNFDVQNTPFYVKKRCTEPI